MQSSRHTTPLSRTSKVFICPHCGMVINPRPARLDLMHNRSVRLKKEIARADIEEIGHFVIEFSIHKAADCYNLPDREVQRIWRLYQWIHDEEPAE